MSKGRAIRVVCLLLALGVLGSLSAQIAADELRYPSSTVSHSSPKNGDITRTSHGEEVFFDEEFVSGECYGCASGCASCCADCGVCFRAEYLFWWREGLSFPALVTSSPAGTTDNPGVLGQSTTTILFGDETIGERANPGARFTAEIWLDETYADALVLRYFFLDQDAFSFAVDSSGDPILARPFVDAVTALPSALIVATQDAVPTQVGGIDVLSTSQLSGADFYARNLLAYHPGSRIDWLYGYQYSRIAEEFMISHDFTTTGGSNPDGTRISSFDQFDTLNEFHGGIIGLMNQNNYGCLTMTLLAKVALGTMRQRTLIQGQTTTSIPNTSEAIVNEGLLARQTNSGTFRDTRLAVSPEFDFNLTWNLNQCLDLSFGYSFIYWSDVVHAGEQIDTTLNLNPPDTHTETDARPVFPRDSSGFWAQGIRFGVQYCY